MGKLLCERIEKIDSAAVCSDPYFIIRLLVKAENGVVAQSPVVARHYVRVTIDTSRMLISPLRILPAHILLFWSL